MASSLAASARGVAAARGSRERFATAGPSPQLTVDAVASWWASRLPIAGVTAGDANLFEDPRVVWAIAELGGVEGASCIELGPLEGGHTYMLERAGAREVVAIEANVDAYLKCLVVKDLLGLERARFLYGDATAYLRERSGAFDVCWCAGILYHMVDPVDLIALMSKRASRLYMWTHFYDAVKLPQDEPKGAPFASREVVSAERDGFRHTLHRHDYGSQPGLAKFWGGTQPYSNWLSLDGLLGALAHFGWTDVQTQVEEDHPHGPAVNLVAARRDAGLEQPSHE